MTKKKKFNCDYNNQAWSKLTKKPILSMSMWNKIDQEARFTSYILSNEHVEQDWPRNMIYFIYIIQWACGTRLTKKQDLHHIYYPMSMWNKIDQETRFIWFDIIQWACWTRLTKEQDLYHIYFPMSMWNKIDQETWFIWFDNIQWACGTRLTKEQDLYHIYYPMSMWNKIDQETRFLSYILSNEHLEQEWPRNKIYLWSKFTKKQWPRNKIDVGTNLIREK